MHSFIRIFSSSSLLPRDQWKLNWDVNFSKTGIVKKCLLGYFLLVIARDVTDLMYYMCAQIGAGAVGVFRVDVTDTGAGIAAEDQQKLFGEFTQFNKNELQAGGKCSHFTYWCPFSLESLFNRWIWFRSVDFQTHRPHA